MADLYKCYSDLEVHSYELELICPICGHENIEVEYFECGKTYTFKCEECENDYSMHFDAS
jgi:transposase-like protein